jgi:demethoxyubiquinone hydroxylase (CLK1/Coq7/Cat5 family)
MTNTTCFQFIRKGHNWKIKHPIEFDNEYLREQKMKKSILPLNFMCGIYLTQKGMFKNSEAAQQLAEAAKNEKTHVERLRVQIIKLDGRVYPWGWFFQSAGFIMGGITRLVGKRNLFKMDTFVENRAVRDYSGFTKSTSFDDDTLRLIREIIAEEERHVENWKKASKS